MVESPRYAVIVIGAGLAGLSASYELRHIKGGLLLLEQNSYLGGRILTRKRGGMPYDLGAIFAVNPKSIPFNIPTAVSAHRQLPIGLFIDGQIYSGSTPWECLQKCGLDLREIVRLKHFFSCQNPQPASIGKKLYNSINAFFQVIHPGDITDTIAVRRRDCLQRFDLAYPDAGNVSVVEEFRSRLAAKIIDDCRVTRVEQDNDGVNVRAVGPQGHVTLHADRVVLATPPNCAKRIMEGGDNSATRFLDKVTSAPGFVVVAGISNLPDIPFSYLVLSGRPVNTMFFRSVDHRSNLSVVTVYMVGKNASFAEKLDDDELAELLRHEINNLGYTIVSRESIAFVDTVGWSEIGPVISTATYEGFFSGCLFPSKNVVLAGDYTWWDEDCMPYGMSAAIESGRRAARMILTDSNTIAPDTFIPEPLFRTTVTRMGNKGPEVQEYIEDGDLSFYGTLLKVHGTQQVERYLVDGAEDGLWPFHRHYGITSLDSALVMEGLLATGRHKRLLEKAASKLVEKFFDDGDGGFCTLPHNKKGRAAYWQGTDCLATAHCAWLLQQIAPEQFLHEIDSSVAYLLKKQLVAGKWPGKWFTSQVLATYHAVRFLKTACEGNKASLDSARMWLMSGQDNYGSWSGSIIETAVAVLALNILGGAGDIVASGRRWLVEQNGWQGRAGEPVLVYWFEDDGDKLLFHSHDKGQVSGAWAKLALNETDKVE